MVCRHAPGDPECSSTQDFHRKHYGSTYKMPETPDIGKFEILDLYRLTKYMVLKVKYPNCYKCSFEGVKVLVMESVPELTLIRWKAIDPHFRDPEESKGKRSQEAAPTPIARFPASEEGWKDAIDYAKFKEPSTPGVPMVPRGGGRLTP